MRVIIEQDKQGYYVAEVPAPPGCISQGKPYEEALENIKEAIEGWLEVMESKRFFDPKQIVAVSIMGKNLKLGSGLLRKLLRQADLTVEEFNEL